MGGVDKQGWESSTAGRWPANVVLDETTADGFEESRFFYVAKAGKKERPVVDGVAHPTVKPLALMRWLVRLVTPPGGTVLEPFAGSGATVEACMIEGFNVIAIEQEADYLPLIQARIDRAA
jgi:site-specific DNA-methyltransferase (adenine-specific)